MTADSADRADDADELAENASNQHTADGERQLRFGENHGPGISNGDTILADVDRALGVDSGPAVEFLLFEPFAKWRVPGSRLGFSYNSFGHAAVRYRLDGADICMNIVGKQPPTKRLEGNHRGGGRGVVGSDDSDGSRISGFNSGGGAATTAGAIRQCAADAADCAQAGGAMVGFTSPSHYLFSTDFDDGVSEQRGVYNRQIYGLRIEHLPEENIRRMHHYFCRLHKRSVSGMAKFNIMLDPLFSVFAWLRVFAERGNCARWTSRGLKEAGLVTATSMWPKSIFVNMFENCARTAAGGPANIHVVSYRRVAGAHLSYGVDADPISAVAPLQSLRSLFYLNLERFADVIVEVPGGDGDGERAATVVTCDSPARPSALRNLVNHKGFILLSVIATGAAIATHNARLMERLPGTLRHGWNPRNWGFFARDRDGLPRGRTRRPHSA